MLASGVALNQINQYFYFDLYRDEWCGRWLCLAPDMEELWSELFLENAKQTYILLDSSKIGQTYFAKVTAQAWAIVITSQGMSSYGVIKKKNGGNKCNL